MPNPLVIDLSHHNPTPNWTTLKDNGTVGVIHKATEGTSYVDDQLFRRAKPAMDAGLCWSTYHFFHGNAEAEMRHYLDTIDPRQGERVCIDHEADATLSELKAAVQYLLDVRPDLQITIYSGHTIKDQLGSSCDVFLQENTSLWIAHYTSNSAPSWPKGTWPQWSLWQYTDKASATGVSAGVDGNRWNGDPANLPKWFGPAEAVVPEPEPEPTPEPEEQWIDVAITRSSPMVTVSVTLDGEVVVARKFGEA